MIKAPAITETTKGFDSAEEGAEHGQDHDWFWSVGRKTGQRE